MSLLLAFVAGAASLQPPLQNPSCSIRTPSNQAVDLASIPTAVHSIRRVPIGKGAELVTVFKLTGGKPTLPVAVGFCTSLAGADGRSATVGVASLEPASWTDTACTLITLEGRTGLIDYAPFEAGRASFKSAGSWPWTKKVSVSRGASGVNIARVRITKVGGPRSLSATEYFYREGGNAANLLLFDRLGPPSDGDTQAAAICGYPNVTRAPALK